MTKNKKNKLKILYQSIFLDNDNLINLTFKNFRFNKNAFYEKVGEDIVSEAFIRRVKIFLNNKNVFAPFLFGLCTKNEFRNRGYSRKVLTKTIRKLNKKRLPFLLLYPYPVSKNFYNLFGFSTFNYISKIAIKNLCFLGANVSENVTENNLKTLYNNVNKNYKVFQVKSKKEIKISSKKTTAFKGKTFGFFYNNYLYAYLVFDGENLEDAVIDYNFLQKFSNDNLCLKILDKVPFLTQIKDKNIYTFITKNSSLPAESYSLIRPINKLAFLRKFKGNFLTETDYTLNVNITDEILKNQTVCITVKNKKIKFNLTKNKPDITLNLSQLTNLVLFSKTNLETLKTNKTIYDYCFFDKY